jgi:hypothetical protein
MNLSDGLSSENPSIAFPNRLFFSRNRKIAASSTSQPGYKIIADWNKNIENIKHKLYLFLIGIIHIHF